MGLFLECVVRQAAMGVYQAVMRVCRFSGFLNNSVSGCHGSLSGCHGSMCLVRPLSLKSAISRTQRIPGTSLCAELSSAD